MAVNETCSRDMEVCLADHKVSRVTVYSSGAEVVREVGLTLSETGLWRVVLTGLSQNISEQGIRVEGVDGMVIHDFDCVSVFVEDTNASEKVSGLKELDDSITKIGSDLAKQTAMLEAVQLQMQLVKSAGEMVTSNPGHVEKTSVMTPDDFRGVLGLLGLAAMELERLTVEKSIINKELERLKKELEELEAKRNGICPPMSCLKRSLVVNLEVKKSGKADLVVTYNVFNVGWRPVYDMRSLVKEKTISILMRAVVHQQSGEDWVDCPITFSTGSLNNYTSPPKLAALTIEYDRPQVYAEYPPKVMMCRSVAAAPMACRMEMDYMPSVVASTTTVSCQYTLEKSITIKSGTTNSKFVLVERSFPAEFFHMAVPSKSNEVFLSVTFTNTSDICFPPGETSVFVDNGYACKTDMKALYPNSSQDQFLTSDNSVSLEYLPRENFESSKGIISKIKVKAYQYKMVIKNNKQTEIKIRVQEQTPRSTDETIKISQLVLDCNPKGSLIEQSTDEKNILTRVFSIKANSKMDAMLRFEVEHDPKQNIKTVETY